MTKEDVPSALCAFLMDQFSTDAFGCGEGMPPLLGCTQTETEPKQRKRLVDYIIRRDQQALMFEPIVAGAARYFMIGIGCIGACDPAGCIDEQRLHAP